MPEDHPAAGSRAGGAIAELLLRQKAHPPTACALEVHIHSHVLMGVWCHVTFGTFTSADILMFFTKSLPVWDTTESSPAFCTELLRNKLDGIFYTNWYLSLS